MVAMTDMNKLFGDPAYLQARMSSACLIIIGIELIKMITSYTIDSVVDVMLLAIARQMIVEHTSPIENLIAVLSIGILFVIRKYLYISRLDRRRSKKEIEEDIRAEVLGVENRNEPKKPEPPEIGSLFDIRKMLSIWENRRARGGRCGFFVGKDADKLFHFFTISEKVYRLEPAFHSHFRYVGRLVSDLLRFT